MTMFQISLFKINKAEVHEILSNANTCSLNDWTPLASTVGF